MKLSLFSFALFASAAFGRVYFEEDFSNESSLENWIKTKAKEDIGAIKLSHGEWYADKESSVGLKLTEDARFYAYSTKLKKPFNTKGKDLVLQYTVKYEQGIDCGGAYLKLLPVGFDPEKFEGDSQYAIMFGPDICGPDNKVHAILEYNNTNHQIRFPPSARTDQLTHQYTFWLKADKSYEIKIDNKSVVNGTIENDWTILPPRKIVDPEDKKPEDWVEEDLIPDPDDKKPEDWVEGTKEIPDPEAVKPADWDDDMDGDWEPPMIPNPKYKGEWKPKSIPNPLYKGPYKPKEIPNPAFEEDEDMATYTIGYIGLDVWTVKSVDLETKPGLIMSPPKSKLKRNMKKN
ncbi:hypothetical protein BB558_002390 [Smittium angustum]|uniref:Calreticulin n=1 Tax=Smittium angustum TaxID=133377 RepID=A0A2U1J8Z2_SMIAN|nr:hypothetical protein BB558_002390 [Smittium angustum]